MQLKLKPVGVQNTVEWICSENRGNLESEVPNSLGMGSVAAVY